MSAAPAIQEKPANEGKVTTRVLEQIEALRNRGSLALPSDYNVGNALNSAWLKFQTIQDKDKRPIIKNGQIDTNIVTISSVVNALHDYCIQGLNCAKNQAYFIVYGDQLVCQRSYFGDQMLAERVKPGIEIYSGVVYAGDDFEYELVRGRTVIVRHKTKLENQDDAKILAVYAGICDVATGEDLGADVMTMERVRKSWAKSKTYKPGNTYGTHFEFPGEMALRTVIRHRVKPILNASTDALLMESVRRQELAGADAEIDDDAEENANQGMLTMSSAPALGEGTRPAETPAQEPTTAKKKAPEPASSLPLDEKKPAAEEAGF